MRKYPKEYLEILKNNCTQIENDGVKIILKPIPGEEREGYLDPCEKAIMDGHWATGKNNNEDNIDNIDNNIVQIIRNNMGFANYNLNTVEIYTKYEMIKDSGNDVGIWHYYPRNIERKNNKSALVFFHGGGWIGGTTYVVENFCKLIAERANCVVFNIDYSLAPEKPFPNGLNDNYYALKHVYENAEKYGINKEKIAIAGDSAGGNYAAAVALMAKDMDIPMVALQVLIYPAVAIGTASVDGYKWSEELIYIAPELEEKVRPITMLGKPGDIEKDIMTSSYLRNKEDIYNPYVSPMLAKSHKDLPKAILVGAEFDGLRLQTEFYAKQLQDAGVEVTCYRYKGTTHAFVDKLGFVPQTEDLVDVISEAIINM